MALILGLDIGGANTKYALLEGENDDFKLVASESIYLPIWKELEAFPSFLVNLRESIQKEYGNISKVVFVTTAELADCFQTKKEGIESISLSVGKIFIDEEPEIMDVQGQFIPINEAASKWLEVAASNWFASAKFIGKKYSNAILIDIGSTTVDILSIHQGEVVTQGHNDLERLAKKELIYTGLLRTNVATILPSIKLRMETIPVSSELFATTSDVYYLLGSITTEEFTVETTDGKSVSKENSLARIAKVICADTNQLQENEILEIAKQIQQKQLSILSDGLNHVLDNYRERFQMNPKIVLIGSGVEAIGIPLLRNNGIYEEAIVTKILEKEVLNAFTAYAVAMLYVDRQAD